jgi:hypothetical protein
MRQKSGRLQFKASLGKKVGETPISTNKLSLVYCNPRYEGGIGRKTLV